VLSATIAWTVIIDFAQRDSGMVSVGENADAAAVAADLDTLRRLLED
jgi:hypothetical protein